MAKIVHKTCITWPKCEFCYKCPFVTLPWPWPVLTGCVTINQALYLYPVPIWIQKRYFIFTFISQYARHRWRSSHASARHSRHQALQHTTWCCAMPSSAASPDHDAGGKCWWWQEVSFCWPCLAGSPGDFRLGWDPGCFFGHTALPRRRGISLETSGRVRRSSVLHEDDMAGADSQRALNNPPPCW